MMRSAATQLRRAVEAFRRDQAVDYLRVLASEPAEGSRAQRYLCSDEAIEALGTALTQGELPPNEHAALCAHLARARLERAYAPARRKLAALAAQSAALGNEKSTVGALVTQAATERLAPKREQIARALDAELARVVEVIVRHRADADAEVGALFARITPPRHPDAGPEGGAREHAERWLAASADLARESAGFALQKLGLERSSGLDVLWASLGPGFSGLFAREGRPRRVASDWEPLGLRKQLTARARVALPHAAPFVMPHLLTPAAPGDVRVSPSSLEVGLASELAMADGIGRAVGVVHASEALPVALRHATVGTIARAMGTLGVLRFCEPRFLRKVRGLSAREAEVVARTTAGFVLLDTRLAAAAALARSLRGPELLGQAAALADAAITAPVPQGIGAFLVTRLSPGGSFRAKTHALGLAWALRERFDEDWFLNPRSAEPLRGAMARAGDFSIEGFAEELGTTPDRGLAKLSELF